MVSKIKSPLNVSVRKSGNCEARSSVSAASLSYDVTMSTIRILIRWRLSFKKSQMR